MDVVCAISRRIVPDVLADAARLLRTPDFSSDRLRTAENLHEFTNSIF